ncbi:NADH-ubiquinone oxidoreductase 29.9 kDa subunit [Sclerotinia borealis F-4128]|uniref:NADH-ubiquinone oxidoreductase 29.9 kDa subunit n=1 Tax=Sclerotinia borealis (strain F-4128) TaxID=1432307 RepID=W9C4E1_SCLBF|nr:NADH-ubiquinone oxidoreductase 29.9 kDa subunit [Sclerotinia borealis F-4128]
MRRTLRQFAAIKPVRYLEPNTPTGLTGLGTHHSPRSALLYLYSSTLDKLQQFPSTSLYRQSTEALINHRLNIVQAVVPVGYEEWSAKAKKTMTEHPEVFSTPEGGVHFDGGRYVKKTVGGKVFVQTKIDKEVDWSREEWDGEDSRAELEGVRTTQERKGQIVLAMERPGEDEKQIEWDEEPALNVDQVEEIENKIGAGLIEEVIQVAEGELTLTDILLKAKVWEDLEEKPVEGQWTYFTRDTGTPTTQQPPPM